MIKTFAFGLVFLFLIAGVSANIIIKSVPEKNEWVADGVTEYRMDVIADTTDFDKLINNAEWDVVVPEGLIVTKAELPSQTNPSDNINDFFYGFLMFSSYNRVDSSIRIVSGRRELEDNTRMLDNTRDGVSSRTGILGSYWFVVPENIIEQNMNFNMNNVMFSDEDVVVYTFSNGGVTIQNTPFTISKPKLSGDANGDCIVNILDLIFIRNRLAQDVNSGNNKQADVNNDGKINVLDLIFVRNRLNTRC